MGQSSGAPTADVTVRPAWLGDAPLDLRPILEIGYEKFGDHPARIAAWIEKLHDYRQFWNLVDQVDDTLEERYERDSGLQARIAETRARPERRVPRPARRTAWESSSIRRQQTAARR